MGRILYRALHLHASSDSVLGKPHSGGKIKRKTDFFSEKQTDGRFIKGEMRYHMQGHRLGDNFDYSGVSSGCNLQPVAAGLMKDGLVCLGATSGGVAGCVGGAGTGAAAGFLVAGPPGAAVGYLFGLGAGALGGALGGGLATQKVISRLGLKFGS